MVIGDVPTAATRDEPINVPGSSQKLQLAAKQRPGERFHDLRIGARGARFERKLEQFHFIISQTVARRKIVVTLQSTALIEDIS